MCRTSDEGVFCILNFDLFTCGDYCWSIKRLPISQIYYHRLRPQINIFLIFTHKWMNAHSHLIDSVCYEFAINFMHIKIVNAANLSCTLKNRDAFFVSCTELFETDVSLLKFTFWQVNHEKSRNKKNCWISFILSTHCINARSINVHSSIVRCEFIMPKGFTNSKSSSQIVIWIPNEQIIIKIF